MNFARLGRFRPLLPAGRRIYALGDIHGRDDLFVKALEMIETDNRGRAPADTLVVLLGDLIDRGPDSAAVVERAMRPLGWAEIVALRGNHEATMLRGMAGDLAMLDLWLRYGGREAAGSWGLADDEIDEDDLEATLAALRAAIPAAVCEWLTTCPLYLQLGDYLFVHAGIRPGVALQQQREEDVLWIREHFLDSRVRHDLMVVHGHSVSEKIERRRNRIGLDTGACFGGALSAMGFEGGESWQVAG